MATVLVTGGTGTLGREVVSRLAAGGHHTRVLSRASHADASGDIEIVTGDLISGAGLREAVAGVDAVIHAASNSRDAQRVDVEGTRRLLDAAADMAPAPHLVYVSIVGVDRSDYPYYVAKRTTEAMLAQCGLPWSIVRATQFHTFAEAVIRSLGADSAEEVVVPSGVRLQSIDAGEVADRLVALVAMGPLGHVEEMGGPQVLSVEAMATAYLQAHGRTAAVRSDRLPGDLYAAFRSGVNLTPAHAVGVMTWEDFLRRTTTR